jgi:DNA-binding transcriptional MerR regulator
MKSRTIKIIKRKPYRTSNIVPYEKFIGRTAAQIASYLSQWLDGLSIAKVKELMKNNEIAHGSAEPNKSNYFYAEEYVEALQRREDERKAQRKALEKKHGRF